MVERDLSSAEWSFERFEVAVFLKFLLSLRERTSHEVIAHDGKTMFHSNENIWI